VVKKPPIHPTASHVQDRGKASYSEIRKTAPDHPAKSAIAFLLLLACASMLPLASLAASPSWWSNYGVLSGTTPNDYAAANQGQAKNVAFAAVQELDNDLAQFGGSGLDALTTTVLSGTSPQENDYGAINLGQLKALAQPFYDHLMAVGYYGPPLIVTGTSPVITGTYPWNATRLVANDYAMANIGQLKFLFSFDVTYSTAGDGIPDWWTSEYFPGQTITSGTYPVPWSAGQLTLNPLDFYNSRTAALTIVSGNNQTGSPDPPGNFVPAPLVVAVTDTNRNPLVNAPVTFAVASGSGQLQKSFMSPAGNSVTVLTNANAQAEIFYQLPNVSSTTCQITATAGLSGTGQAQVTFSESTDGGTGTYASPFAPSNASVVLNSDGSLDLSWQNNTDDPADMPISIHQRDGSWKTVTTVPAGTTTAHIPPQ
jgi:hypothetical protein